MDAAQRRKIAKVFHEGKRGQLRSSSGKKVQHGSKQEVAIALNSGRRMAAQRRHRRMT